MDFEAVLLHSSQFLDNLKYSKFKTIYFELIIDKIYCSTCFIWIFSEEQSIPFNNYKRITENVDIHTFASAAIS